MAAIRFTDRAVCDALLADVRSDATDTNWALFAYDDASSNNTLTPVGSGSDGVDGLVNALSEETAQYGLVRVIDYIDGHSTVKFVQITYVGARTRMMLKARMGTQKMAVNTFMGQHHVQVSTSERAELTAEQLARLVGAASGSNSAVMSEDKTARRGVGRVAPVSGRVGRSSAGGGPLEVDAEACAVAVGRVRADDDDVNWALFSYTEGNRFGVLGSGAGGLAELCALLQDAEGQVSYGLLRTHDVYDGHTTTKFVYIEFVGERVPTIRKAVTATHKGAVAQVIGQVRPDAQLEVGVEEEGDDVEVRLRVKGTAALGSAELAPRRIQRARRVSLCGAEAAPPGSQPREHPPLIFHSLTACPHPHPHSPLL
jgi:Cofilin/tropomyosin-type actin-binding protein